MTKKAETVKKGPNGQWQFLHPLHGWTGSYTSRVVARAARASAIKGQPFGDPQQLDPVECVAGFNVVDAQKVVDSTPSDRVSSHPSSGSSTEMSGETPAKEHRVMAAVTLTLDPKQRKSTSVVFKMPAGIRGSVRVAKTAFANGAPPQTLTLQSDSENAFAAPRQAMTPEERKQARKNAPKLTAAQKLAKLQERARKLEAKVAAEGAAGSAPAGA